MWWFNKKKETVSKEIHDNIVKDFIKQSEINHRDYDNQVRKLVDQLDKLTAQYKEVMNSNELLNTRHKELLNTNKILEEQVTKVQAINIELTNKEIKSDILLKDILEAEDKKKEVVTYVTKEGNILTIKSESSYYDAQSEEINSENELASLNDLLIKLLPYINNKKEHKEQEGSNLKEVVITNELTILVP